MSPTGTQDRAIHIELIRMGSIWPWNWSYNVTQTLRITFSGKYGRRIVYANTIDEMINRIEYFGGE